MRVDTAFLAPAEATSDGRIFVHGGGIEGFVTPAVPLVVPLIYVVVRIYFSLEIRHPHTLKITVTDPHGKDCGLNAVTPLNPAVPEYLPELGTKLFATFGIYNLKYDEIGVYTVNVFVDDEHLDGFPVESTWQSRPRREAIRPCSLLSIPTKTRLRFDQRRLDRIWR